MPMSFSCLPDLLQSPVAKHYAPDKRRTATYPKNQPVHHTTIPVTWRNMKSAQSVGTEAVVQARLLGQSDVYTGAGFHIP
jgi:hypothetical protein